MRFFRFTLLTMLMLCLISCTALGEAIDAQVLTPLAMSPDAQGQILDLYCGPTQGFYRHEAQTLDTGKDYVLFGQYDCWAMAAQGTPDSFGPIGWVEAGSIMDIPYEPQLSFEEGFAAMIEESAPMTNNPLADDPFAGWTLTLEPGMQITVLAQLDGWLYVQAEMEHAPIRAFIKANTVF